jgi:hypothetical protein
MDSKEETRAKGEYVTRTSGERLYIPDRVELVRAYVYL